MTEEIARPKVGLGVIIFKEGKILLGRRKSRHANGVYSAPGGKLEYLESFEQAARREVVEECGLKIKNIKFFCLYNLKEYPPDHYVNIGFTAEWESGEPQVLEPEKIDSWNWYALDKLPKPLFAMIPSYLEAFKTGKNFFDS